MKCSIVDCKEQATSLGMCTVHYKKSYYARNRSKLLAKRAQYYSVNKDKCKAAGKKYYKIHAKERAEYQRQYRAKHSRRLNAERRKERQDNPALGMLKHAKASAKRNSLPFDLRLADIVIPKTCPVLGVNLTVGLRERSGCSPSLDRIVPSAGYVKGNVRVISWRANDLKKDASVAEMRAVLKYMEQHSG